MKPVPQTAIVLANGRATLNGLRLAAFPKLLLPIANRPMVDYLALALCQVGVRRMVIVSDVEKNKDVLELIHRMHALFALETEWALQEVPRGTGGTLKEVERFVDDDCFWAVNGDLLIGEGLVDMLSFHREHGHPATVATVSVQEPAWQMERVEMEEGGKIKAIHRVHPVQNRRSTQRPVGIYLLDLEALHLIPNAGYFDLKEQLFTNLHARGIPGTVWEIKEYCRTITSLEDYIAANRDVLLEHVHFPFSPPMQPDDRLDSKDRQSIPSDAVLVGPVSMGSGFRMGERAIMVGPTVIGDHCEIGNHAVLSNCIVFRGATIGEGAHLSDCVLGEQSSVAAGAVLREQAVLRDIHELESIGTLSCGNRSPFGLTLSTAQELNPFLGKYHILKRFCDILISSICLVLAFPLMVIIAVAIKLESPGRVIYRQCRSTLGGREFTMYKFRSMVEDAELIKRGLAHLNEVDGPMFKITDDPRTTRLGRILRKTNLDELPQLWNVLKGDMSLIGPRPLSMDEMRFNPKWRDMRLSMRPGLTGLWQVESHSKASFADWIRYDNEYANHCSLQLDGRIFLKTLKKTFQELLRCLLGTQSG